MSKLRIDAAALLAGLALASLPAPAAALRGPSVQAGSATEAASAEDRQVLLRFSRCVVGWQRAQASALVLADYRADAYQDSLHRLTAGHESCVPGNRGRLRFGGILFAGDLAEILLADAAPRGSLAGRVALNPAAPLFAARDQSEVMSVCVVRAAPAETETLLATAQGSPEEAAALNAVAPHIGPCLAAGAAMRLNRPGLRAMLALAAYRLVQHNAAAPAAVAAGN
jgi:hypothetical protein